MPTASFGYIGSGGTPTTCENPNDGSGGAGGSSGSGGGTPGKPGGSGGGCGSCNRPRKSYGTAEWWLAQARIDLHLEDTPLSYQASRGMPVSFQLSYRQRELMPEDPAIFGVGTNWTSSCRVFLLDSTSIASGYFRLHRGGAGSIDYYLEYYLDTPQFFDGSILTTPDAGATYQIEYANGAKDVFAKSFVDSGGNTRYFLTSKQDPAGNAITYNYATNLNFVRLSSMTDPDSRNTQFYYENASFTNQITKVVDPFNRTNRLQYDASGYLTNIVDVIGLTSAFVYDSGARRSWITNLITAYGTTRFRFGGVDADSASFFTTGNLVNRFAEVTEPNGGKHLFVYRQDCSSILSASNSPVPNTSPFANTLDNVDFDKRNSFHWEPIQYAVLSTNYIQSGNISNLTSTDYLLAGLQHWLVDPATAQASRVLSLSRAPSADAITAGQLTWFDYPGKAGASSNGTTALPLMEARVMPDGTSWFGRGDRNTRGSVTNAIETYTAPGGSIALRTNKYIFASNSVDLVQHIGPEGYQILSNYFNAYHQPLASYDALNQATLYTYNTNHQVTSVVTPAGLTTINTYYSSGTDSNRLQSTVDLEISRTNSYTYYTNGLVLSHTDERGLATINYWDNLQRPLGVSFPDGTTMSNIYTALDITATKDRLGYWSYTGYNAIRQKTAETNANNVVTRYGYCDCGALLYQTNAWNTAVQMVTSFAYDYQGNRTYTFYPDATVTNYFDSLRRVTATCDAWGCEYFGYDQQGHRTSISNSFGAKEISVYDIDGRVISMTDANGVTVTNTYDVLDRLSTRTYPDGGVEGFAYSARGLIAQTNQLNKVTLFGYDEAMRKIAETNANNEILRYTNNASGDLLSLTDGKNQTIRWKYDEFGRVTNKTDQAGSEILRYNYDANGRLTNRWSVAKGDTGYGYDAVGNLTAVNYPTSPDVTFGYDALNRKTNMMDAVGTTAYAYTSGGQLWTEDGPFADDTVTNIYNNRLRTGLGLKQPTGSWTNGFGYDAAKRLTSVASPAGSFAYQLSSAQPSSLVQKLSLPNTSYITNTFDSVARLTGTWLKNSTNGTLDSYQYSYNLGNQRTQVTRTDASTVGYNYDSIGQLTNANSSVSGEDKGYRYDAAWNLSIRTNTAGDTEEFGVDGLNQLTNTPGGTFTYDSNGNLVAIVTYDSIISFCYDDENRLTEWIYAYGAGTPLACDDPPQSDNDRKVSFTYDGLGRLRRALFQYAGDGWASSWTENYVYDEWRVIQERDAFNNPTVSYTRGNDLSGTLAGAGGIGGLLARTDNTLLPSTNAQTFYHADGNGNITYLVKWGQTLGASYRYDPFGNTVSSSGDLAPFNRYRFSSKASYNEFTGSYYPGELYYYGYRFYSPNLQRWLNQDPAEEKGFEVTFTATAEAEQGQSKESNLFYFAKNEPIRGIDALGLIKIGGCNVPLCNWTCIVYSHSIHPRIYGGVWVCRYLLHCWEAGIGCTGLHGGPSGSPPSSNPLIYIQTTGTVSKGIPFTCPDIPTQNGITMQLSGWY